MNFAKIKSVAWLTIEFLILAFPAMLAGFSSVLMILLLLGQFKTEYIWTFGGIVSTIITTMLYRWYQKKKNRLITTRETKIFTVLSLLFVVIWVGINLNYNSEHVFINRDPGIYAVTAEILEKQQDLNIARDLTLEESSSLVSKSAGFDNSSDDQSKLFAQGAHLLPALLGFGARIGGDAVIFNGNVLIAGLALITIFGFAVNFVRPRFAFLSIVSLGLLLPFIYFSRDTYTEILALIFTFGALNLIYHAQRSKDNLLWLIAGLTLGAGAFTRIDAYLSIAAMVVFAGIYIILNKNKLIQMFIFLGTAFLTGLIGILDVRILASGYFINSWPSISKELILIALIIIVMMILAIISKKSDLLLKVDLITRKWRAKVTAVLIISIWTVLASRMFWLHNQKDNAEFTVAWIAVYLGPIMLLLGVLGLSLIAYQVLLNKKKAFSLMPFLLIVMVTSIVYVTYPSIAPDQVWASRRMLPIIFPGLIIAGVYFIDSVLRHKLMKKHRYVSFAIAVVLIIGAVTPLATTYRFARLSSFTQIAALRAVCNSTPKGSSIIWIGRAGSDATISSRAFCDVNAVAYSPVDANVDKRVLVDSYQRVVQANNVLYVGIYGEDMHLLPSGSELSFVVDRVTKNIEVVANKVPTHVTTGTTKIFIGQVDVTGNINELNK